MKKPSDTNSNVSQPTVTLNTQNVHIPQFPHCIPGEMFLCVLNALVNHIEFA